MAKNIGIISGRVELDSVDFTKNLAAMKRELRTLKTDTELAKRGFDVFGDGVTGSAGVMKTFEDQIKVGAGQMKRYSDDFNKAMKENDGQLTRASQNAQRNFKRMQLEVSKAAEEYYNYALQEERANNAMYQGAARMVETGDRWKKTGKSIEDFGKSWTRAGVAVGLGVTAVTKTAIDFESGVTEMAKTIDVSDEKFADLTQGVRDLALEIPIAASELAELAAIAGQFGIHEDSILSFTETVAGLEVATDMTAESAGMMIAQFAQITDMDHSNFDRLGSSVVELGNNLPTTEKAIMDMAMGLAGAGNTAGMTESEIIGLAGGLSSLGISSERGASSFSKLIVQMAVASATGVDAMASLEAQTGMTRRELELMASNNSKGFKELAQSLGMTTSEMNDAIKASIDLEGYASVAGLTIEEFARVFEEDAVGAIGLFVDGLAQGNDETGTAIEILDELGITEIRLRDTLLRTGNAQGVLNDAVRSSNEAWEENVALTNEADLFYNNTASQLTILGNKMKDVAIELGTALLPVLNDFIDGLDPLISGIKGAATWFTNLDEGTQKLIASATGLFIIGGPIVSLIGKTIGGVGTLTGGAGKLAMKLLDVGNQSRAAKRTGEMLHRTLGDLIGEYGFGGLVTKLDAGVGGTDAFAGSMATAAGAKGAGAMTGALSALNPWLVGLVGAGGLLVLGYGAWKLWGEEAYEAGERTKKWGTDVGEATEGVLGDIENTLGTFNLLQQGVNADSALMVGDFQKMGQSIEDDINRRLLLTEEYLGGLPETLRNSVEEILGDYQENLRETNEVIKANNEEVARIQQQASEENRELNAHELAYINELQRYSTDEYISILDITAEEEKTIRRALSGDVENINKEQTLRLIAMLNEENKAVEANRQADLEQTRAYLDERNLLNTAAGDEILQAVNDYYDAMGVSGQRTMQELYNLYPELVETHDLATGNMLSTNKQAREKQLASNALLVESWEESHRDMGNASEELAKAQELIVDSTRAGAETWNRLVAESGGNMDVFREKVFEAAQTAEGWNDIRFQIHEANLESDALLVIGEAAIANGWWDGMAWEDKQAILKDNFSDTVYQAIVEAGHWDKLTIEEKTALLNNGFTDTVIQGLIDSNQWNKLTFEEQEAILKTNSTETLLQILDDLALWEKIDPEILELLLDSTPAEKTLDSTTRKLDKYGNIIEEASLEARDNTAPGVEAARKRINSLPRSRTTTLTTRQVTRYESYDTRSGYQPLYAQGTDYHVGGAAILGDGGRREPFLTPQGAFGVSPDSDTMYDLPRGTKVWSSIQNFTSQLKSGANKIAGIQVPKFATGTIDFPNMQELLQPFSVPQTTGQSSVDQSSNDTYNIYITAQGNLPDSMIREMAVKIEREIKKKQDRKRGSRGERVSFG